MEKQKNKGGRPKKTTPSIPKKPYTLVLEVEENIKIEKAAEKAGESKQKWCKETLIESAMKLLTGKQEVAAPKDNVNLIDVVSKMIEESNRPLLEKMDKLIEEEKRPLLKRLLWK